MKKVLHIIFIPLISFTITSCGFFNRMTDPFTDLIAIFDEGNYIAMAIFFILFFIGVKLYGFFDKDKNKEGVKKIGRGIKTIGNFVALIFTFLIFGFFFYLMYSFVFDPFDSDNLIFLVSCISIFVISAIFTFKSRK